MFGQNPLRKNESNADGKLAVQEIFPTLQGEGPLTGVPAVFVRLAGCTLACSFCDTQFESNINNRMTLEEIGIQIQKCWAMITIPNLVVLTGGEPLRQNVLSLVKLLVHQGLHVQIETAGTSWVEGLEMFITDLHILNGAQHRGLSIVCSPKTGKVHKKIEQHCHHWKYIIREGQVDEKDGLPNYSTQREGVKQKLFVPTRPHDTIWVQPCDEDQKDLIFGLTRTQRNTKLACDIAIKHGYRLSLQVHKVVNLP